MNMEIKRLQKEILKKLDYFQRFDLKLIIGFYQKKNDIPKESFKNLNWLLENVRVVLDWFENNSMSLSNDVFNWEILDNFEDIYFYLQKVEKIAKFLRTNIVLNAKTNKYVFQYPLKKGEDLENVSKKILHIEDKNKWVDIAKENDLDEIYYGEKSQKIFLSKENEFDTPVTSMVDYNIGKRIFGIDIDKNFKFENNDLAVLDYDDTLLQTIDILSNWKIGDVKEYEDIGVNLDFFKGINISILRNNDLMNSLERNFKTDDLFKNINFKEVELKDDNLFIKFTIETKSGDNIQKEVSL